VGLSQSQPSLAGRKYRTSNPVPWLANRSARRYHRAVIRLLPLAVFLPVLCAQTGENVLLVVNGNDPVSRQVGEYYRARRNVPSRNLCILNTTSEEEISWKIYEEQIENPVGECLRKAGLEERVLYIATTLGVPLKVDGSNGMMGERASVDSELALLYAKRKGTRFERAGPIPNPFFMVRDEPFQHPRFPIYLVTRLAAWDLADVKAMIDHGLAARNRGKFVIDLGPRQDDGNTWLRNAAMLLPRSRVVMDDTDEVLYNQKDAIGYASWGSNDAGRTRRWSGFRWLPGALVTEFVSSNARTLRRPPEDWFFHGWDDQDHMFGGSSQGLSADYIHEGATGVSGNVYEPYLTYCVRPDYLLPAYYQGRNLAESFYIALRALSWQGVVLGDPLVTLGKP
jgi:uncharacterized protein (TIGR03790 family)